MFTKTFLKDLAERAIATFAQAVLAVMAVVSPSMEGLSLLEVNYVPVLLVGLVAALLSVLKAVVAAYRNGTDSASLSKDVVDRF